MIERIADELMAYLDQESTLLPSLKQQLRECEKSIQNMLNAIEAGIITPSTKKRLQDLETRREELNISILQEQLQKPGSPRSRSSHGSVASSTAILTIWNIRNKSLTPS